MRARTIDIGALIAYAVVIALFIVESYIISTRVAPSSWTPWIVILLGLTMFRGGRLISGSSIAEPLRFPVAEARPDSCMAGDSVSPIYDRGALCVLGQLVSCPVCSGFHVGVIVMLLYSFAPAWGFTILGLFAASGLGEMLNYIVEPGEWAGRLLRVLDGIMEPSNWDRVKAKLAKPVIIRSNGKVHLAEKEKAEA